MLSRRRLILASAGTAGALVLGWSMAPPRQRLTGRQPLPAEPGQHPLNGWVRIGADDLVTVMIARAEMGQGVASTLAAILAEELDARWAQVRVANAPIDDLYNNLAVVVDGLPFHPEDRGLPRRILNHIGARMMREIGLMATGGSSSIKDLWLPMREAGASARAMMLAAAARRWGVTTAECVVAEGRVSHRDGRSASFGELAVHAAAEALPARVALKPAAQWRLLGRPLPRLDAADRLTGSTRFGIDAAPPEALHARVLMCPTLGGSVAQLDAAAARALPGVVAVAAIPGRHGGSGGVVVIADAPWRAERALRVLEPRWAPGSAAGFSSAAFLDDLIRAVEDDDAGFALRRRGDPGAAQERASRIIEARYRAPFLAHHALEPLSATVRIDRGRATVWVGTQVPDLARMAVARALDLPRTQVDIVQTPIGGSFGRRLDIDFIAQAADIAALAPGRAVQTVWTREQDSTHDTLRPACAARLKAALDADGRILGWLSVSAGPAPVPAALERYFGVPIPGPDKTTLEGAFDQPYAWPATRIAHRRVDAPVPVGFWRSVGHSHQAFFTECFLDEVAQAAGHDPVELRASLLAGHPRHLAVLRRAAEGAGWSAAPAPAFDGRPVARGIALHEAFGSVVAQVAEVSLDARGGIRVHRVVCAIDCGTPVNPNLIRQQVEGGVIFGLSAALHGETTITDGRIVQTNFHEHRVLRLDEAPVIETLIVESADAPAGVGEPPVTAIAPAVANALARLTGQRLRSLPLRLAAA
jgi:isoquinoline 1-oxidoreductase beta subunit